MRVLKKILTGGAFVTLILVLLAAAAAATAEHFAAKDFKESYALYLNLAQINQNDAFVPGASGNPLRQELNNTLALALSKETSTKERLRLAYHGLDLINAANKQIDQIAESNKPMGAAIDVLRVSATQFGNLRNRGTMTDLVSLAQEQLKIIEDIKAYSYRANYETKQIFNRLIDEKGSLTDTYVTELNNMIPNVEEQFGKRENLYLKLEDNSYRMSQKFDILNKTL